MDLRRLLRDSIHDVFGGLDGRHDEGVRNIDPHDIESVRAMLRVAIPIGTGHYTKADYAISLGFIQLLIREADPAAVTEILAGIQDIEFDYERSPMTLLDGAVSVLEEILCSR